jgi:hypothetical protein
MPISRATFLAAAACATGLALPAAAEFRFDNDSGGYALFYGQFNPAYLSFDDGVSTFDEVVDNGHSNSRVGFWIRQPFDSGEFAFNLETGLGLRPSFLTNQLFTPKAINWQRTSIRKVDFSWKTENAGTFYLGQGSDATDGVAHSDMSGTTLVTYNSIADTAGAALFRTAAGALSARTIAQAFPSFDGGRTGRIRYDSPSFGGVTVSASYGEEILAQAVDFETADIALRYAGEIGATKIRGAVGYSRVKFGNGATRNDTMGSVSMLHASGFNATLGAGSRNQSGDYIYGKLGYQAEWFAIGGTALSVDYYDGDDMTVAGSQSQSMGIGVVQSFDQAGVDAYLGYREYQLSEPGTAYRDATSVLFGAIWRF